MRKSGERLLIRIVLGTVVLQAICATCTVGCARHGVPELGEQEQVGPLNEKAILARAQTEIARRESSGEHRSYAARRRNGHWIVIVTRILNTDKDGRQSYVTDSERRLEFDENGALLNYRRNLDQYGNRPDQKHS